MTNNKQTAVEWVIEQLTPSISLQQKHIDELKEKAKEMEKEQIKDAYFIGGHDIKNNRYRGMQEYYNETYGGNK
jgi:FtsZ-binding cell division protein ZapB